MARPVELAEPLWPGPGPGLAPDRFHRGTLQTVGEVETSDAVPIELHTFGAGYRVGSLQSPRGERWESDEREAGLPEAEDRRCAAGAEVSAAA